MVRAYSVIFAVFFVLGILERRLRMRRKAKRFNRAVAEQKKLARQQYFAGAYDLN